jgi:aspartate kinase
MIVTKFGGSSLESSAAILRVAEIVKARLALRPVVVVSAMGKTTDSLLAIAEDAARGNRGQAVDRLRSLEEFHIREFLLLAAC